MQQGFRGRRTTLRSVLVLAILLASGVLAWMLGAGRAEAAPAAKPSLSTVAPTMTAATATVAAAAAPQDATPPTTAPVAPQVAVPQPVLTEAQILQQTIAECERTRDTVRLHRVLGEAVASETLDAVLRTALWPRLEQLNAEMIFSTAAHPLFVQERVRRGDSLWSLCQRVKRQRGVTLAPGLLSAVNHVPASGLKVGAVLKVPAAQLAVIVDKSDFRLFVQMDGITVLHMPVGIGRDGLTPEERFTIGSRVLQPDWTDPKTGKTIAFGQPGHLIGSRWLGFSRRGAPTGFGIHGTVEPDSIGKAQSDGCIRLGESDLIRLFELLPEGCEVLVRP